MAQSFLIYAMDGNGLRHIVRTLAVATRLRKRMPGSRFLFLTSCEDPAPIWREGFVSVNMPSAQIWSMARLEREEFLRIVKGTTRTVFRCFQPSVLITDTVPQGKIQDLTRHLERPIRKILLLRPPPVLKAWKGYLDVVRRYDHLLIPHEREEGVTYPGDLAERGEWIGRIMLRSHDSILPRAEARQRLGLPQTGRVVLLSFGSGGNPQIEQRLGIVLKAAAAHPDVLFALLRPPMGRYRPPPIESDNVQLFSYFPIMECFAAFDAAVCTSRTNGADEFVHAGLPMVWVPVDQVSHDQVPNAVRYARQGIGLLPRPLSAESLAAAIRAVLDEQRAKAMRQRMAALRRPNGADLAAERIAAWCAEPGPATDASRPEAAKVAPPA